MAIGYKYKKIDEERTHSTNENLVWIAAASFIDQILSEGGALTRSTHLIALRWIS
jgi:hypothetical protein